MAYSMDLRERVAVNRGEPIATVAQRFQVAD